MDLIFSLFDFWITPGAQSWINVLQIGSFRLFYIEWDYDKKVKWISILGLRLI